MASRDDTELGRKLVDSRYCSTDELKQCRTRQAQLESQGVQKSLADIVVEHGYATPTQIERLQRASDDDSMSRPAVQQQIPGLQILRKLGQGAMATVFEAKQLSLDRRVAVKVLPKRLSDNPEFVQRFEREGRAAARLSHANIVQAIDVGESGGYHYFVMEYVDGATLYDRVADGKPMEEREALRIVMETARALEHAHTRGLIHRDVKPKNIMITKDGMVKLADMGLAREASDYDAAKLEKGRAYGTPYYISPEQIRGEIYIDFRADIYSLGATFYHMLTGRVPFDGPTPTAVMHMHLKEPLVPPDHLNPKLSAGVAEVVELMMAKNKEDRYPSTRELIADIEALLAGEVPLMARRKYDPRMLQNLAESGVTVSKPTAQDLDPEAPRNPLWMWVVFLSIGLLLSLLVNIALLSR